MSSQMDLSQMDLQVYSPESMQEIVGSPLCVNKVFHATPLWF